jgi:hypothetical protein
MCIHARAFITLKKRDLQAARAQTQATTKKQFFTSVAGELKSGPGEI